MERESWRVVVVVVVVVPDTQTANHVVFFFSFFLYLSNRDVACKDFVYICTLAFGQSQREAKITVGQSKSVVND